MFNKLIYYVAKFFKKSRLAASFNSTTAINSSIGSGTSLYYSTVDRYSFCGYDCDIYYTDIGKFTSIASGVVIGGAKHPMDWAGMSSVFYSGRDSINKKFSSYSLQTPNRTKVGNDVWIGRSSIIMSGLTIGNGSVIGAGSVVTKNIPPYAIVAGNPAKIIRYRFDKSIVDEFESVQWWNLDEAHLYKAASNIRDPLEFLKSIKSLDLQ